MKARGSRAPGVAPTPHVGDAILKGLSTITLASWANKRMAEYFYVPQLVELVQQNPRNVALHLQLGLRLKEMETLNARIRKSIMPTSATSLVLRPVTRTVVSAMRSDKQAGSEKLLEPLFGAAMAQLQKTPKSPTALLTLARIYGATGHPQHGAELAYLAVKADPEMHDAAYFQAEMLLDLGQPQLAYKCAEYAYYRGNTLTMGVLDSQRWGCRAWLRSTRGAPLSFDGPTTTNYWRKMDTYYEGASVEDLTRFMGPSVLTAWRRGTGVGTGD